MSKPPLIRSFLFLLIYLAIFLLLLFFGLKFFMSSYTNHGSSIQVPDVKNKTYEEAKEELQKSKLNIAIQDSTYTSDLPPGAVIDQNPKPAALVKKKRTVYLVVNSTTPPPVKMPTLVDNNLKIAEIKLNNLGLKLGKKIYKPDIAKNAVLQQLHNGKPIASGTKILKGQTIDLVLGDGFGNTTMKIPDLVGLSYDEAILSIQQRKLSVGKISKTESVVNVKNSMVYEQYPSIGGSLEMGQTIDLYLTNIPTE